MKKEDIAIVLQSSEGAAETPSIITETFKEADGNLVKYLCCVQSPKTVFPFTVFPGIVWSLQENRT